jgi:hypothetical protein
VGRAALRGGFTNSRVHFDFAVLRMQNA